MALRCSSCTPDAPCPHLAQTHHRRLPTRTTRRPEPRTATIAYFPNLGAWFPDFAARRLYWPPQELLTLVAACNELDLHLVRHELERRRRLHCSNSAACLGSYFSPNFGLRRSDLHAPRTLLGWSATSPADCRYAVRFQQSSSPPNVIADTASGSRALTSQLELET